MTASALPPRPASRRLAINVAARTIRVGETPVHLAPKAFDLLALLRAESPRVVSKRELQSRLWPEAPVSDATLVGLVKEVRRALATVDMQAVIRTAHRVGYAFAMPDDRPTEVAANPAAPVLLLGSRSILLNPGENIIGRDDACTVPLKVSRLLSRRHARVHVSAHGVTIEDLGSTNGTFVGGVRITEPTPLQRGDRIVLGGLALIFDGYCSADHPTEALSDLRDK